ncbi:MAG: DUF4097 family beta strand repeat-containing protein [Eubacteriales bacterium]|nr:DUF4097 family beta strand repeat-containing protein [Eubacteriales bacterium]
MKKGWKIFWIVCGISAAIGIILCISGLAMGASLSALNINVGGNGIHFVEDDEHPEEELYDDEGYEVHEFDRDAAQSYDDVKKVKVDVSALELEVLMSEDECVWVDAENLSSKVKFQCRQEGDELILKTDVKLARLVDLDGSKTIRLYLPEKCLEEIDITNGAGTVRIEYLNAEKFSLDIGAGDAAVKDFDVTEAEIDCGAGEITAYGSVAKNIDIECGVGEIGLTLEGNEEDYTYNVDCGVGEVVVGQNRYEGVGNGHNNGQNHHGKKNIDVECGIGSVTVQFTSGI